MARDSLEIKRKVIQRLIDQGLFPYTKRYLGTLRNHFSTIGVNGINEMIRNFSGDADDITTPSGHAFAVRLLDHVRARMVEFQEETGHLYNLEATPAEGTTYRFAKEDRKRWPGILQAGTPDTPYYTNSSQLPVGFTDDPFEALARQEALQSKYTGGTVLHLYMNERVSSASRLQGAGAPRAGALPPALHHDHADVLDLPDARLPRRRASLLPQVRRRAAGREATADWPREPRTTAPANPQLRDNPKGAQQHGHDRRTRTTRLHR